ncbi:ArsR family transcriptional regulator [Brevibacterium sanguinis]|uniref:ArsR family transcriptional regulator n=2 Tax=Brevibacterium TaxID=1696 RepID=A0A366IHQ9_9MICO|nr:MULTISPECIES: metalloregulator ArsR/SmtB family transcription factor [Brevibacterium]RBP65093.1 ArsR family transcriptional regulator [Brevibacterium sanguinis]RBP71356.1 ArsR family transcriptional regulator [Brevibacterium celere]
MGTYQSDGWAALGDPSRRAIFASLAERPRSVRELADDLPISRPAVSQHLKVLLEAKLVSVHSEGTRRIYRVDQEGLKPIRNDLDSFWASTLANFKRLAEEQSR